MPAGHEGGLLNLYMATMMRVFVIEEPAVVSTKYQRALIHAKTPQMAGKMLKKIYPEWERVEWRVMTTKPIVLALP